MRGCFRRDGRIRVRGECPSPDRFAIDLSPQAGRGVPAARAQPSFRVLTRIQYIYSARAKARKSFAAGPARLLWHNPTFPRALATGFCCRLRPLLSKRARKGRAPAGARDPWTRCTRVSHGQPDTGLPARWVTTYRTWQEGAASVSIPPWIPTGTQRVFGFIRTSRPAYFTAAGILGTCA